MTPVHKPERVLAAAITAARCAGALMRRNLRGTKRVNSAIQHDIKLELDVRCQKLIERTLRSAFPETSVLGEEGIVGDVESASRWVVDPIDGTVNFAYGIPHACVSIALQTRKAERGTRNHSAARQRRSQTRELEQYETVVGVVYDPFCDELWTAVAGGKALLNGKPVRVSSRNRLNEAIVTVGFAKYKHTLNLMLPVLNRLVHRVRKIRVMGSAALAMTYVASGRMDAYLEPGIRLWDIAAGGLILERAGGDFWHEPLPGKFTYRVMANNGLVRQRLERFL